MVQQAQQVLLVQPVKMAKTVLTAKMVLMVKRVTHHLLMQTVIGK